MLVVGEKKRPSHKEGKISSTVVLKIKVIALALGGQIALATTKL